MNQILLITFQKTLNISTSTKNNIILHVQIVNNSLFYLITKN
jgi:hypothetical protein